MYKYEYETVRCDFGGWGLGSGNIQSIEDQTKKKVCYRMAVLIS